MRGGGRRLDPLGEVLPLYTRRNWVPLCPVEMSRNQGNSAPRPASLRLPLPAPDYGHPRESRPHIEYKLFVFWPTLVQNVADW